MEENKLYKSLIISALVLAGLSLGVFLPQMRVVGYEIKGVDLFADIRFELNSPDSDHPSKNQPSPILNIAYLPYLQGITANLLSSGTTSPLISDHEIASTEIEKDKMLIYRHIQSDKLNQRSNVELVSGDRLFEDYSPNGKALNQFFTLLDELKQGRGKGRIAMFGDSFIEGDIFCSEVRNSLQDQFGGNGVGFVPITSEVAQFRNTVGHNFSGFNSYTVVKKDSVDEPFGAGGYCFTAGKENYLTYSVNPKYKHLKLFHDVRLFFWSPLDSEFKYRLNDNSDHISRFRAANQLQQEVFNQVSATSVSFRFPASDSIKLYGVSFEDSTGIYIDNFGLRGNSGLALARISDQMVRQFNHYQDYKLIILQYGLNVIGPDTKDFSWYLNPMIGVVQKLKRCYPDASILLMSVSDRSTKVEGQYQTMESVPQMIDIQRKIAKETQIAFFNLYAAMGGKNSMIAYVENDPPLANKDYTHLNFLGGRKVANVFVTSLINEFKKYNDQNKSRPITDNSLVVHTN